MSKYTTEVRYICESYSGVTESVGYKGISEVIAGAIPKIFDFDFPIYDESYRNVLCTKILKHYYTREIGAETVGLWKLWLDTRMNEIMPYYNQLYKSALLEFNPLYDVDITTEQRKQNDGTTDVTEDTENTQLGTSKQINNASTQGVDRKLYSDTPQGSLDNIENETYLTNATKMTNDGSSESETDGEFENVGTVKNVGKTVATTTEEYLQTVKGKTGGASYSKRFNEYRSTFINIDRLIIDELKDLFINLW